MLWWPSGVRAQPVAIVLDREDVAVEGGGPLPSLHGHFEIAQSVANIALDLAPEELRVSVGHVGGAFVAQLVVDPDFREFAIEGVELARVERVAQLADEVAGADEGGLVVGAG